MSRERYYEEEFIFRKPAWRRVVPTLLLLLTWVLPLFLWKGPAINIPGPLTEKITGALAWLDHYNVTLEISVFAASAVSVLLLFWLYYGLEKLIITPDVITRKLPFTLRRSMRWADLDEVLIDHVEARFEGEATIKKVLMLFAVRRRFMPWRRKLVVTNRQFDDYEEAERLALEVSVPSIALRKRESIAVTGKPALFAVRDPGDALTAFIYTVLAVMLGGLAAYDAVWPTAFWFIRPYIGGISGVLLLLAVRKMLFRQVGIDMNTIYIMRRGWIRKRISIEDIADVRVRDNQMRIFTVHPKTNKARQVFKTNKFIRNRGVLLSLIREGYETRQAIDATPIPPMQSIRPDDMV